MASDQVTLMHRLGFDRFHVVGHDRGGRTGHRMALDVPGAVVSLAVLDIAPTHTMFMETNRHIASAYWNAGMPLEFADTPGPQTVPVVHK